uniref:Uncharacterized protein n=1 Tax=Oryza glumipatula TaxID=40148 RepID=A0A0D9Z8V6_9ORYZ
MPVLARVVMTWSLTTGKIPRSDGGVGAPGARAKRARRGTAGAGGRQGPPGRGMRGGVGGLAAASQVGDGPDRAEASQDEAAGDGPTKAGAGEANLGDVGRTVLGAYDYDALPSANTHLDLVSSHLRDDGNQLTWGGSVTPTTVSGGGATRITQSSRVNCAACNGGRGDSEAPTAVRIKAWGTRSSTSTLGLGFDGLYNQRFDIEIVLRPHC